MIKIIKTLVMWLGVVLVSIGFITFFFFPWELIEGRLILVIGVFATGLVLAFSVIGWDRYKEWKLMKEKIKKKELKP